LEDSNYPVWFVSVEGIATTIEDAFTNEELKEIEASIVDQAQTDFNEYY